MNRGRNAQAATGQSVTRHSSVPVHQHAGETGPSVRQCVRHVDIKCALKISFMIIQNTLLMSACQHPPFIPVQNPVW